MNNGQTNAVGCDSQSDETIDYCSSSSDDYMPLSKLREKSSSQKKRSQFEES